MCLCRSKLYMFLFHSDVSKNIHWSEHATREQLYGMTTSQPYSCQNAISNSRVITNKQRATLSMESKRPCFFTEGK